jgi:hypothetical protein
VQNLTAQRPITKLAQARIGKSKKVSENNNILIKAKKVIIIIINLLFIFGRATAESPIIN